MDEILLNQKRGTKYDGAPQRNDAHNKEKPIVWKKGTLG